MITGWREIQDTGLSFKIWAAIQTSPIVKIFSISQHPVTNRYVIGINDMSKLTVNQLLVLASGNQLDNDESFTVLGISFSTLDAAKAYAEELDKLENTEANEMAMHNANTDSIASILIDRSRQAKV